MTISQSAGKSSVLLWLSISWSSVRQYGTVAFATGNGFASAVNLLKSCLILNTVMSFEIGEWGDGFGVSSS